MKNKKFVLLPLVLIIPLILAISPIRSLFNADLISGTETTTAGSLSTPSSALPKSCTYKGKAYKNGESFRDECNSCGCSNGQVRCTERACIKPSVSPSLKPSVTPIPGRTCTYEGKIYKVGEGFKDDCNSCSCTENGQVACTLMACASPSATPSCKPRPACLDATPACAMPETSDMCRPTPTPKPTCAPRPACLDATPACQPPVPRDGWCPSGSPKPTATPLGQSCTYKGKTYRDGEGFKDDCNSCGCSKGQVVCTQMACASPSASPSIKPAVTPIPGRTCTYKGNIYKVGESFKDDCNSCGCSENGQVVCTAMACASPSATPSCKPRPACLDATPACAMPETPDMCRPTPPLPGDPTNYDCSYYKSQTPVRENAGAAFNPFSPDKRLVLKSQCSTNSFRAYVEGEPANNKTLSVFHFGFKWNGKSWDKFEFIPADDGEAGSRPDFLDRSAISKEELTYTGDITYWIAYTCAWKNNNWKCGCSDETCAKSRWNMQGADPQ